jgi:CheY-like chemotaxis protein
MSTKRLLFVDDNAEFLAIVQTILGGLSGNKWEVFTAPNAGMALQILQDKTVDLVVVDVHMPVVDGFEFLTLLSRKHPNVPKAVLTSDPSEAHRAACLSRGAETFLQKPLQPQDWQKIYVTLSELTHSQAEEGFRGVLRRVGLQDVLQMECLSRNSSVLEVKTRHAHGNIFIESGQIIHAEAGQRSGEDAFNYLMALSGGEFNLRAFTQPSQRTISVQWEFLLMEAARKRDEDAEAAAEPPSPFQTAPIPMAPAPTATAAVSQMPNPFASPHTQFLVKPAPPKPEEYRPEIVEFIILSSQADVLYKWQCEDINGRIGFLEFLSQRARQVAQGLPLGQFERFEVHGSKTRAIAHLDTEHAFLVRTNLATTSVSEPLFV